MNNLYDRNEVLLSISDVSKEAYGYRVRQNYAALSDEELFATYDLYLRDASRAAVEELEREEAATKAWNAHICNLMNAHGISRRDALRWDLEAEGAKGDPSYYCFLVGIGYSNAKAIAGALG
jgi:hypothetical protein